MQAQKNDMKQTREIAPYEKAKTNYGSFFGLWVCMYVYMYVCVCVVPDPNNNNY